MRTYLDANMVEHTSARATASLANGYAGRRHPLCDQLRLIPIRLAGRHLGSLRPRTHGLPAALIAMLVMAITTALLRR